LDYGLEFESLSIEKLCGPSEFIPISLLGGGSKVAINGTKDNCFTKSRVSTLLRNPDCAGETDKQVSVPHPGKPPLPTNINWKFKL